MNDNYLTPQQVQQKMNIKKNTFYRWRNDEGLPIHQLGKKVYVIESELVNWFSRYKKQ